MANKNIPDIFNEVAKAIQKKTGETKAVDPNDFAQKIEDIPQEVIVHGDMDDAFDEAKGDAIWEDGYFLGYYNSVTKEVKIDLEPIMVVADSDPASWVPAICSSGSVSAHDVGIQEIASDETHLEELNAYDIYFAGDSERPDLSHDQFIGIELNMGSESSEEFEPTGKVVNGIYKKYTEDDLYTVASSGTSWGLKAMTEDGALYMTSSSGSVHYYKMRFEDQESDEKISSSAAIYKYLGSDRSEPDNHILYNVGASTGIYTIDTDDSDLMYSSWIYSDLPEDGDLLKVVMSSNKIELEPISESLDYSTLYYYYEDYYGKPAFKEVNDLYSDSAYIYNGEGEFTSLNIQTGLQYVEYDCTSYYFNSIYLNEGEHYTYDGSGQFNEYDPFNNIYAGCVYNYLGDGSFEALDSYSLYKINQNSSGGESYEKVTLPTTESDSTTIIVDGYSYTITNNGPVE